MKLGRLALALATTTGALLVAFPGCQDPTQVTILVTLDPRLTCAEIAAGTVIAVGADAQQVEANVLAGVVATKTNRCDDAKKEIGTLVVTPSDAPGGAVTVLVGYGTDPAQCRPPLYEGCIVARRRFTFVDHTPLTIPIVIDADCKAVPCDAFSTCSRGVCFDSDVACPGGDCTEPGELPDGAPNDDAAVFPDVGVVEGGLEDRGPIPGRDGGSVACVGQTIYCPTTNDDVPCAPPQVCCRHGATMSDVSCGAPNDCTTTPVCCANQNCPTPNVCEPIGGVVVGPGMPQAPPGKNELGICTAPFAYCPGSGGRIMCPAAACGAGQACCVSSLAAPGYQPPPGACQAPPCAAFQTRYCCNDEDCGGGICAMTAAGQPGTCP